MRYAPHHPRHPPPMALLQPYDAFLVLDVEATCLRGTDFNYPNEIIEFPICLMKWQDTEPGLNTRNLQVVDEFRSFVRPSWRPTLSGFCTELTGITQDQVDAAPLFPDVLKSVHKFMLKHGLVDATSGKRLVRFCWCSDGPFDIRDFMVKQCFISNIAMPEWLQGDVFDVRLAVMQWLSTQPPHSTSMPTDATRTSFPPIRRSLNISAQLNALGLPGFEGRQHSGIDDARNIAKIVAELSWRGVCLRPNTIIRPGRRWLWMGKKGKILEEYCASFNESAGYHQPVFYPSMSVPSSITLSRDSPAKFPESTLKTPITTSGVLSGMDQSTALETTSTGIKVVRANHGVHASSHGHRVTTGLAIGIGRAVTVPAAAACVS